MIILNISVVIPCYNSAQTIKRCLDSVINQSALPREIILVDDGSDQSIEPLIALWRDDIKIPIYVIRQLNRGAAAARNAGIKLAQGQYIAFLDADDVWLPNKLEIQYKVMQSLGLTISGHGYRFESKTYAQTITAHTLEGIKVKKLSKWQFALSNPFFTPTVMVSKAEFKGFDERFRRVDDFKAWVENFRSEQYGYIDSLLAVGFKPAIGHSGLTESVTLMHHCFLDVLKALHKERQINLMFYGLALAIETIKLPLRRHRAKKLRSLFKMDE